MLVLAVLSISAVSCRVFTAENKYGVFVLCFYLLNCHVCVVTLTHTETHQTTNTFHRLHLTHRPLRARTHTHTHTHTLAHTLSLSFSLSSLSLTFSQACTHTHSPLTLLTPSTLSLPPPYLSTVLLSLPHPSKSIFFLPSLSLHPVFPYSFSPLQVYLLSHPSPLSLFLLPQVSLYLLSLTHSPLS